MQNFDMDNIPLETVLRLAVEHHQLGRLDDAKIGYHAVLQTCPRHPAASHNLGVLAMQLDQPQAALPFLITSLEVDPDNDQCWLSLIECLVRLEAWFDADDLLRQAQARGLTYPVMVEWRTKITAAQHAAEESDLLKTLQAFAARPMRQHGGNKQRRHADAMKEVRAFFLAGDWKNMETAALAGLKSGGEQGRFWYLLGVACLQQEKFQPARVALEKASALLPKDAEVWDCKAVVFNHFCEYAKADECYQRSLVIDPRRAETLNKAGINALDARRYADAERYLQRALELQPDFALAHNNIGNAHRFLGRSDLALAHYQKALQFNPDLVQALSNLGCIQQELGMLDAAVVNYQRALQLNPDYAECLGNLGFALYELGRLDDAQVCFRQALTLKPNAVEILCGLARVLLKVQRISEAADLIQRGLALAVTHPACVLAKLRLMDARGEFVQANGYLDDVIDNAVAAGSMSTSLVDECLTAALSSMQRREVLPGRLARIAALPGETVQRNGMLAIYAMLAAWLDGDDESLDRLATSLADFMGLPDTSADKSLRRFAHYLQFLRDYKTRHADLYTAAYEARLNVIGDSHSLSPANVAFDWQGHRVCGCSHLVVGVKMHHLAQAGPNRYKYQVEGFLRGVAVDEPLLITIGEIDCRPYEGIWKAWRKKGVELEDVVNHTVDGYLAWLAGRVAETGHGLVTLQGIPAPGYILLDGNGVADIPVFLGMIRAVNLRLQAGAAARGWHFLDVYSATVDESGFGNGRWHLDGYHLQPGFYCGAQEWLL